MIRKSMHYHQLNGLKEVIKLTSTYEIELVEYLRLGQQAKTSVSTRNRTKKKDKSNRDKRDGQPSATDQYEYDENTVMPINDMNPEEKLKRLQELEHKLIGGEEINNEERKRKRKKKLNEMREKQEQRKRFTKAVDGNDDDMMMNVFDNVQEEVCSRYFLLL